MAVDLNRVAELLQTLSPMQEKVVRLYFGLGCQQPHSASAIAREFLVSPQAISGILGGAERKLARVGLTPSHLREAASLQVERSQSPTGKASTDQTFWRSRCDRPNRPTNR